MKKQYRSLPMVLVLCLMLTALFPIRGAKAANVTVENAYSLYDLGLFQGTSNGFQLEQRPTRLEGMTMFVRLLGGEKEATQRQNSHPFSDVPGWGDPYVGYAWRHELTKGISGDTFGSTDYITLEQYVTFVLRALRYDDSKGDFTWDTAVDKAVEIGLLTRGEAGTYLSRSTTRGTMVDVSFAALRQPFKDSSKTLAEQLVEDGVFSREAAIEAGLWTGETHAPEPEETPAPKPSKAPKPEKTPEPTEPPESVETPKPTEPPESAETPKPTETPERETIVTVRKPEPSESPQPVEKPGLTYSQNPDTEIIVSPDPVTPESAGPSPSDVPDEPEAEGKVLLQEHPPYQANEMSFFLPDYRGAFSVMGVSHREGMVGSAYYETSHALFNLKGEHRLLTFTSAPIDDKTSGGKAVVYFDGRFIDEFDVDGGSLPANHSYDVTGVGQLRIEFLYDRGNRPYGVALYDMRVE